MFEFGTHCPSSVVTHKKIRVGRMKWTARQCEVVYILGVGFAMYTCFVVAVAVVCVLHMLRNQREIFEKKLEEAVEISASALKKRIVELERWRGAADGDLDDMEGRVQVVEEYVSNGAEEEENA